MKRFFWSGISNDDTIKAISEISSKIDSYAIILNFQRFSDISIGITIEIEECNILDFHNSLKSILFIEGFDENISNTKKNCIILLNISFTKGTGDMIIEVPNIPE